VLHGERVESIALAIARLESQAEMDDAEQSFGLNIDKDRLAGLKRAWQANPSFSPLEVAAGLRAARRPASSCRRAVPSSCVDGPKTGLIPIRSTEQVS